MKNTALIAFLALTLGFAGGWLLKIDPKTPEVVGSDSKTVVTPRLATSDLTSQRAPGEQRQAKVETRGFSAGEEVSEDIAEQMANRFEETMKKSQRKKFDLRLAKLTRELNLTPAQVAELQALWEEHSENMGGLMSGDSPSVKEALKFANLMGGRNLDELLKDSFTAEQQEAFAAFEKKEFEQKVESRALKGLAQLSFLDLRDNQRDAVMEVLYTEAEEEQKKSDALPANAMTGMIADGFGIEIDAGVGGFISGAITEGLSTGETDVAASTSDDFMKRMQASQQKRIDEKVEALAPILDEIQLSDYRESLESKNQSPFGSFFFPVNPGAEVVVPAVEESD